jgi:hypothetical protein
MLRPVPARGSPEQVRAARTSAMSGVDRWEGRRRRCPARDVCDRIYCERGRRGGRRWCSRRRCVAIAGWFAVHQRVDPALTELRIRRRSRPPGGQRVCPIYPWLGPGWCCGGDARPIADGGGRINDLTIERDVMQRTMDCLLLRGKGRSASRGASQARPGSRASWREVR